VIHTASRRPDRQALRPLVLPLCREITLIETIQNYPTAVMEVEGERLESAFRLLRRLRGACKTLDAIR